MPTPTIDEIKCGCPWTPSDFDASVTEQISQYSDIITKEIGVSSPFPSLLDAGVIPNNQGNFIRTLSQGLAAPNVDMAAPVFYPSETSCDAIGEQIQPGQIAFSVVPESLIGHTAPFCVMQERLTVLSALASTIGSLKTTIAMIIAADIQNQMLIQSGLKILWNADVPLETMYSGGNMEVDQPFAAVGLPNTTPTFKALTTADTYNRENMDCRPFSSGNGEYCVMLSGKGLQDKMFFEDDLKEYIIGKPVQGGYLEQTTALKSYAFTNVMAKGMMFGIIQTPPRFADMVDTDGAGTPMPVLINPYIKVATDTGYRLVRNPQWLSPATAPYEIGYLVYPNSFKRLAPVPYTGEGQAKFPAQTFFGEIQWFMPQTVQNMFQKSGLFGYQIMRAYEPVRPHCIVPFAFKRCPSNLGLVACSATPSF